MARFPRRIVSPYPYREILSGYEEDVSSIRDDFTAWVKSDPETILKRHVVDSKGIYPAYREAPARRHSPSSSGYHFDNNVPNRSAEQTRRSVSNWNPGPRRGKAGAIESHIAGKWHIITLQEAIEYLEHDFLTNRFHVTHYGGCAILFNKDTFFSDIKVSSFYLHDTRACEKYKITEGESGWVMQGVVSKAAFRRQPRCGQQTFTVMSLHINNNFAKKRDIGKKLLLTIRAIMQDEHVDLVACDFNGAAWRQLSGNSLQPTSTLRGGICRHGLSKAGPTPLWGPGAIPGEWTDVCGFIVLPNSHELWKVRLHGAFTMPREILGLSQRDQSCHHEVWLHLEFVGDRYAHGSRMNHDNRHDNRVLLMERSCPYPRTKEKGRYDDGSDHSLSSLSSARELMLP